MHQGSDSIRNERAVDGNVFKIRVVAAHVHAVDIVYRLCEPLQFNLQLIAEALRSLDNEVNGCSVACPTRSTVATILVRL